MPPVTVTVQDGQVVPAPTRVVTNPGAAGLTITWNFTPNPPGFTWSDPPLAWASPTPSGYQDPPSGSFFSSGPNQWSFVMPSMSPNTSGLYKYNIVYSTGVLDPEAENQGVPPGTPAPSGVLGKPAGTPGVGPGGDNPSDKN